MTRRDIQNDVAQLNGHHSVIYVKGNMASIPKRTESSLLWSFLGDIKVFGATFGIDSKRLHMLTPIYRNSFVEHVLNNCHFLLFQNRGRRIMRLLNKLCEKALQGFGICHLMKYALSLMI